MLNYQSILATSILLSASLASAEELITFHAGQVAKAVDINANFQTLANAHTPQQFNILSNGVKIGFTYYEQDGPNQIYPAQIHGREVALGYLGKDGRIRSYSSVYFKSDNCSGQGYLKISDGTHYDIDKFNFPSTKLYLSDFNDNLYYIDGYTQAFEFDAGSELSRSANGRSHNCRAISSYNHGYYVPWQANNTNITGISSYPFATPISLEGHTEIQIIQQ